MHFCFLCTHIGTAGSGRVFIGRKLGKFHKFLLFGLAKSKNCTRLLWLLKSIKAELFNQRWKWRWPASPDLTPNSPGCLAFAAGLLANTPWPADRRRMPAAQADAGTERAGFHRPSPATAPQLVRRQRRSWRFRWFFFMFIFFFNLCFVEAALHE